MPSSGISTLNQGIHGNRKTMTKFLKMNPIIFVLLLVPFQRLEFGPVLMFVLGRILTHFQECFTWPLLFQNFTELVPGTYILPNLEMFHPVSFLFRAFLKKELYLVHWELLQGKSHGSDFVGHKVGSSVNFCSSQLGTAP